MFSLFVTLSSGVVTAFAFTDFQRLRYDEGLSTAGLHLVKLSKFNESLIEL